MRAEASQWKHSFDSLVSQAGAIAWGARAATEMDGAVADAMTRWTEKGMHAAMGYLTAHARLKRSLANVLPGCRGVVSLAFPYFTEIERGRDTLAVSRHALADDYHIVLRERLRPLADNISLAFGGETRICVDSAPVAERYWAAECKVGSIGRNGLLYVPGYGSWVFLAEILSTAALPDVDGPAGRLWLDDCEGCSLCADSCPGKAIKSGRCVDSNRCRAYLTIECRDEQLPRETELHGRVYGCDVCQEVCPANRIDRPDSPLFRPRRELLGLTVESVRQMDSAGFKALTRRSSMSRITLSQLKRNAGLTG